MDRPRPSFTYRVLRYAARVELLDLSGERARYTRTETVEFLKDADKIFDYGWGDGIAFADHDVDPGKLTARHLIGPRLRSTVALPARQRAGDVHTFTIERLVQRGFESPSEWWLEAELYHPTDSLDLGVLLPAERPVKLARVVTLDEPEGVLVPPTWTDDRRQCIGYSEQAPRLGQRFTILWDW
ncbi:MAG: hypothetical protein IT299_04405 [Dehalococcoidia bacterium]|nr:hypothetical protein [Dehalococcoidia bacterium]